MKIEWIVKKCYNNCNLLTVLIVLLVKGGVTVLFFVTGEEKKKYEITVEEAFNKYSNTVWRLAFSKTANRSYADDILQDVFLKFLNKNPKFYDADHCKAWLIRVTINCANNLFKSAYFKRRADLDENLSVEIPEVSEVYSEVLKLPKKYRTVIHLYYYEGYSINEIATFTKSSMSTVKTRLFRARKQLEQQLKGVEFDV